MKGGSVNKIDEILKEFKETTIPFETCYSGTGNREVIEDSLLRSQLYSLTKQELLKAITEDERWKGVGYWDDSRGNFGCGHESALAEILEVENA
mgnify:CR=1 FL=1